MTEELISLLLTTVPIINDLRYSYYINIESPTNRMTKVLEKMGFVKWNNIFESDPIFTPNKNGMYVFLLVIKG